MNDEFNAIKEMTNEIAAKQGELRKAYKVLLKDSIAELFLLNPEELGVKWGAKSSEYNDEGMYPGVAGPVFINEDQEDRDWIYDGGARPSDTRLHELWDILHLVDTEVLTEIFQDSSILTVRNRSDGELEFEVEWQY